MRILRLIRSVHLHGGGPIEGIRQVSQEMMRRGHTVEIASLDPAGAPWLGDLGLKHHALGLREHGYGYSGRYVPWLRAHVAGYDAVIVSGLWQYTSFGAWRALRDSATPYFVFPHGMLDAWFKRRYPLKHLKKWLYWPWADYRVLRDARAVLFTSEEERRSSRESFSLYRCRERVVNYGTAASAGDPDAQRAAFFAQFPELRGGPFLLYLGRLHEKKGCELLIQAFAKVAGAGSPRRLVLAGPCADPQYALRLRALAASCCPPDSVSFPGMLSGEVKWGAFRAAEAFVLPSHQENFGLAVAEALACGTPVLLSDKVNIWREIEEDGAGLVESDTLAGVEQLLARFLALTPEQRQKMSTAARRSFARRFEIGRAATALLDVLAEGGSHAEKAREP